MPGFVTLADSQVILQFPYNPAQIEAVKRSVPHVRWDSVHRHWWVASSRLGLKCAVEWGRRSGLDVTPQTLAAHRTAEAAAQTNLVLSHATALDHDALDGPLLPYQHVAVEYVRRNRRVFLADDLGAGKTCEALTAIETLGAYPCLIVVPANLKEAWKREVHQWLPHRDVVVLSGETPYPIPNTDLAITGYHTLHAWQRTLQAWAPPALIADESFYARNHRARRTQMLRAIAHNKDVRLLVGATPMVNRAADLIPQLQILDRLEDVGGFWQFLNTWREGSPQATAGGAVALNTLLRETCLIRRMKAEILPQLPPLRRVVVPLEIDNRSAYEEARKDLRAWLRDRFPHREPAAIEAQLQHSGVAAIVRIEALRQLVAHGKLRGVLDWMQQVLHTGNKLVVFGHHRGIQTALAHAFPGCAVITGGMSDRMIEQAKDRFQADPRCRVCVGSLLAGSVGHTLTAASNAALVEFGWTPADHDQAEARVHRLGQTATGVTIWYLVGEDTIDEDTLTLIDRKRKVVSAATDGRIIGAERTTITADLIARLLGAD